MPRIILILLLTVAAVGAKPKSLDPRIKDVRMVFVKGNNEAAERAREEITKNGCLHLAGTADAADGVLDINADAASSEGGQFGSFGARNWIVSATLTLKSGDLIWSHSDRQPDAPFRSGGKTAGKVLVKTLAKDAGCK